MAKFVVFIDESGTLPDPKDRFIVFAAVVSDDSQSLVKLIPKARKKVPPKKKQKRERLVSEFKFRSVGDKTKTRILKEIARQETKLFVLVVDKKGKRIEDTPKNYARLVATLLKIILKKKILDQVFIDLHYNQVEKQRELTKELLRLCSQEVVITHTDSLTDSRVDLADFMAGAVLKDVRDNISSFKSLIEPNIETLKMVTWKNAKVVGFKPDRRNLPS